MKYTVTAEFNDVETGKVRQVGEPFEITDVERADRLLGAGVIGPFKKDAAKKAELAPADPDENEDPDEPEPEELDEPDHTPTYDELKAEADELKLKYRGNIGSVKLAEMIAAKKAELAPADPDENEED